MKVYRNDFKIDIISYRKILEQRFDKSSIPTAVNIFRIEFHLDVFGSERINKKLRYR